MQKEHEGATPPQESKDQYQQNPISESEFRELTSGSERVGSRYGQYGSWVSYKHPNKEGWFLVEDYSKDSSVGGFKYFETNDTKWQGHEE